MLGLRLPELLIILVVLVLVFGANKIPQLGDALGRGIQNFKKTFEKADPIDVTPEAQAQHGQLPHASATATPPAAFSPYSLLSLEIAMAGMAKRQETRSAIGEDASDLPRERRGKGLAGGAPLASRPRSTRRQPRLRQSMKGPAPSLREE